MKQRFGSAGTSGNLKYLICHQLDCLIGFALHSHLNFALLILKSKNKFGLLFNVPVCQMDSVAVHTDTGTPRCRSGPL